MPKLPETSLDFGPDEHIAAIVARPFWKISEALKTMVRLTGGDPRLGDPALVLPLPHGTLDQRSNLAWVCCGWVSSGRRDDGGFNYALTPMQKFKAPTPLGWGVRHTLDNHFSTPSYIWTTARHTFGQPCHTFGQLCHTFGQLCHTLENYRHTFGQLPSHMWSTTVIQLDNY